MRTIIAGSRSITDFNLVLEAVASCGWEVTHVISGGARGVDRLGERYAKEHNLPLSVYPADWDKYGIRAGMVRNAQMAMVGEALIAVWDGESRGTRNMIEEARKYGLRIYIPGKKK